MRELFSRGSIGDIRSGGRRMPKTVVPADRGIGAVMSSRAPIRPRGGVKTPARARTADRAERAARTAGGDPARTHARRGLERGGRAGLPGATVAHVTSRARVSRRTFYDVFDNREDCLLAALGERRRADRTRDVQARSRRAALARARARRPVDDPLLLRPRARARARLRRAGAARRPARAGAPRAGARRARAHRGRRP